MASARRHRIAAVIATCAAALAACGAGASVDPHAPHAARQAARTPSCPRTSRLLVVPPAAGQAYLGAFPFLGNTEDQVTDARLAAFEQRSGRRLAWVYVSNNWMPDIRFPAAAVRMIRARGAVPFIRLMPRSTWNEYAADPRYSMASIVAGRHDAALHRWAHAASQVPGPLLLEFGTEVNGAWFPWNGSWNGGARTTRYGDPHWPDGPERFRDAYRRIVRIFRQEGARNVTWVFHVDASPEPDAGWNAARWYWPGDAYVDWIGLSAYGPQSPDETLEPFAPILERGYRIASSLSRTRPIALVEFAIAAAPGRDTAGWTRAAFAELESGRYPRLRGVAWWHERWTNDDGSVSDLRIDSTPELLDAYRGAVAAPRYVTSIRTACRPLT